MPEPRPGEAAEVLGMAAALAPCTPLVLGAAVAVADGVTAVTAGSSLAYAV
jgi:hypothetical protein